MAETRTAEKIGITISGSACQRYFGFLSQRSKGASIPEDCLTCEKMLDCMTAKPEASVPATPTKKKVDLEGAEKATSVMVVEEVAGTLLMDKPKKLETVSDGKKATSSPKSRGRSRRNDLFKRIKSIRPEKPAEEPVVERSDDDFFVESPGMMYGQWSGTVIVGKDTLESWGKKVKEVEVQTHTGRKTRCKVYAVSDLAPRVVQVPSRIKAELGIGNGEYVRLKPVTKDGN